MSAEHDPWAVEKVIVGGVVAIAAIITTGVIVHDYLELKAPCREVRIFGGAACPAGAHVEHVGDETWCKCGPPTVAAQPVR